MQISRRAFIAGASASAGLAGGTGHLLAELSLGEARLTTVSDGHLELPGGFVFAGLDPEKVAQVVTPLGVSTEALRPECNVTLLRSGDNLVLFDTGAGGDFMPSAGALLGNLEAAGHSPEEITHVVFTHAHPDHIWGLLDDFDDPIFTEAQYLMGRTEWDYWWDPETVDTIGTARQSFAVGAKRRMEMIADQVTRFDDGAEILPGVLAVETPGHTPGHMAFELAGGAMILGDALGNHHLAFARPSWHLGADQAPEQAAQTRLRLLDRITHEDLTVVGFHLPGGGIGRAEAHGEGYRFIPG